MLPARGPSGIVRMLLSTEGIDPNRAKKDGVTPLYMCLLLWPSGRRAHAVKY